VRLGLVYLTVIIIAACGLGYELVAGALASYLLGDSVTQFSTVIGVYLFAMGVGSWLSGFVRRGEARLFVQVQLLVGLVGGGSAALLFVLFPHVDAFRPVLYGLILVVGTLVGLEIPLLLRILKDRLSFNDLVAKVFTFDYVGALLASLLFPLVLVPRLGLIRASCLFGMLNVLVALLSARVLRIEGPWATATRWAGVGLLALLGSGFAASSHILAWSEAQMYADPVLHAASTPYQRIVLTRGAGDLRLHLNGNLQFSSRDEYRYHEALVHPALAAAPRRTRVMILGGGDGLAAREVLRYRDVSSVTLVDLDPAMTNLARRASWLRALNQNALHDPRMTVVNDDAMVWLTRGNDRYGVAVVAFPDPNNFALGKLYTRRFYQLLRARLTDEAVVVVQASSALVARRAFWCVERTMASAGFVTEPYHAFVPSFGEWGYVRAGVGRPPPPLGSLPAGLRYLTAEGWRGMTAFPPDMARAEVEVNRLNNQVLVRYYEEAWHRFTQ